MKAVLAAPLALACGIAAAQAQTIYRCGDSYGSQPCAGAKAIATEAPVPTADESQRASAAAQRDARLADALEKERLKQEARPAQVYVSPPPAEAKPEPHKWPEKAGTRKLDVFTATAPGSKPAKNEKGGKSGKGKGGGEGIKAKGDGKPAQVSKAAPGGKLAPRPATAR
jgi:hypothetical protein